MVPSITGRRIARESLFRPEACCSRCGWDDPTALVEGSEPLLCYECYTGTGWELHHIAGRANNPHLVYEVPGNIHRLLSDRQYDWPAEVRHTLHCVRGQAPRGLKLLAIIAGLLGMADYYWVAAQYGAEPVSVAMRAARRYYWAARVLWRAYEMLCERKGKINAS